MSRSVRITAFCVLIMLVLCVPMSGSAAITMKVNVSSGSSLNLRDAPDSRSKVLASLRRGTEVTVVEIRDGWAAVMAGKRSGYVCADYLTAADSDTPLYEQKGWHTVGRIMQVNVSSLNLRATPSANGSLIDTYNRGTQVEVDAGNGEWYHVSVCGKKGYMKCSYLSEAVKTTSVFYAKTAVNLRAAAGINAKKLDVIPTGAKVTVYAEKNGWSQVSYNGTAGYVSTSLLTDSASKAGPSATVSNTYSSYVNLRSEKKVDNGANVLALIKNGTSVTVLKRSSTWTQVSWNGMTGYMLTSMLTFEK